MNISLPRDSVVTIAALRASVVHSDCAAVYRSDKAASRVTAATLVSNFADAQAPAYAIDSRLVVIGVER